MTKKNTFKSVLYAGAAIAALSLGTATATNVHADTTAPANAASTRVHNQVHQLFQLHKTRLHQLHQLHLILLRQLQTLRQLLTMQRKLLIR